MTKEHLIPYKKGGPKAEKKAKRVSQIVLPGNIKVWVYDKRHLRSPFYLSGGKIYKEQKTDKLIFDGTNLYSTPFENLMMVSKGVYNK